VRWVVLLSRLVERIKLMAQWEKEKPKQSIRTKNRLREHKDHNWNEIQRTSTDVLFDCSCGWLGWLPIEELN
jgi:hypothetical protein